MTKRPTTLSREEYLAERAKIEDALSRDALTVELTSRFLAANPEDPFANFALAQAYLGKREINKALPLLEKAVAASNYYPIYVDALAQVQLVLSPKHGLAMLQEAIEVHPDSGLILAHLGAHFTAAGQPERGLEHLRRASTLATGDVRTMILRALTDQLLDANLKDEAQTVLSELSKDPAQKAFVATRRAEAGKQDLNSPVAVDLLELIESAESGLPAKDRARVLLAYGNLAENSKDYDLAFQCWEKARTIDPPNYDPAAVEGRIDSRMRIYSREAFAKTRTFAHPSGAAIFVCGMPRSGTTLIENILDSHPKCKGIGEFGRLRQSDYYFLDQFDLPRSSDALFQEALKGGLRDRATDFLRHAEFIAGGPVAHYVDKTPTQFAALGAIHMCMPNAKFIHSARHPADTFISTYQNAFSDEFAFAFTQERFAHLYLQREKLMAYWRSLFGSQILDVRYEELVADPEPQVRRILTFLGLDWDPAVLRFYERSRMVRTFSRDQVRHAVNTKSVGRWRNYEKHLGPLFAALKKAGYSYPETSA